MKLSQSFSMCNRCLAVVLRSPSGLETVSVSEWQTFLYRPIGLFSSLVPFLVVSLNFLFLAVVTTSKKVFVLIGPHSLLCVPHSWNYTSREQTACMRRLYMTSFWVSRRVEFFFFFAVNLRCLLNALLKGRVAVTFNTCDVPPVNRARDSCWEKQGGISKDYEQKIHQIFFFPITV